MKSNIKQNPPSAIENDLGKNLSNISLGKLSNTTIAVHNPRSCFTLKSLSRLKDIKSNKPALWICKIIVGYPKLTLG